MEHNRSCWVNCSFLTHWIEANCLTCFTKDLPVWKDNPNEFYIIANYKFNQQTYSFPIRIEKNKTSTFLKAFEVVQTAPNEYKETKNLTELVKRWLGPNQDFYDKVITPTLLGVSALKVCFVDLESFDTIERVFQGNDPIVLAPEVAYKPPSPRMSMQTFTDPLLTSENEHSTGSTGSAGESAYWIDSPAVDNDPREPRTSFTFSPEKLTESHLN